MGKLRMIKHIVISEISKVLKFTTFVLALGRSVVVLAILLSLFGQESFARYENPRFSLDERWLVFDNCEGRCRFVVYSIEEKTAFAFDKPPDEDWINPSFGLSSDRLTFVIRRTPLDGQVAVLRIDGSGLRVLTASNTIKRSPSFSPDGKSIIFVGNEFRESGPRGAGIQDVYAIALATKEEQRITDLRVQRISAPFFMPDGERLVISAIGASFPRSRPLGMAVDLDRLVRDTKVKIFVFPLKRQHELIPYIHDLNVASQPMPLQSGEVAVVSRVNDIDGIKGDFVHDIFLANREKSWRHTRFRQFIRTYGISASGKQVAFVTTSSGRRYEENKLMLWVKSTGEVSELKIPNPRIVRIRE